MAKTALQKQPDNNSRIDDVHFRLDEIERRLTKLEVLLKPEALAGVMHGVLASHVEALPKDSNYALIATLRDLIDKLSQPVVRKGTVDVGGGPVTMTVVESRHEKPNGGNSNA